MTIIFNPADQRSSLQSNIIRAPRVMQSRIHSLQKLRQLMARWDEALDAGQNDHAASNLTKFKHQDMMEATQANYGHWRITFTTDTTTEP